VIFATSSIGVSYSPAMGHINSSVKDVAEQTYDLDRQIFA